MSRRFKTVKQCLIAGVVLAAAVLLGMLPGRLAVPARAEGENEVKDYVHPEEYENGYYEGEVTKDGSRVRKEPGSRTLDGSKEKKGELDDTLKTSTGKDVILSKGAKVTVWGESKDSDLDIWYHVKFTYSGEEFEGYIFSGRVKRSSDQITFSPTPSPVATATDTEAPTPTEEQKGELIEEPAPSKAPSTKEMAEKDKKNPWSKWTWFLIIVGIILVGALAFTLITYLGDRKIDEEMSRSSSRRTYEVERLEGESEEDFREAKNSAIKGQLRDQTNRDIAAEIGVDEFKLDLDGVFDDEAIATDAVSEAVTEAVTEDAANHGLMSDAAAAAESVAEATGEWDAQDAEFLQHLTENADEQEKALLAQIVPNYGRGDAPAESAAPIEKTPEEIIREKLDLLKEQDTLVHREYGVGEVIDNSDPQMIQVRFGRDLRFLKKDRLARKQLVDL